MGTHQLVLGREACNTRAHIPVPYEQIADFCRRHSIRWLALFGSVLRDDFEPNSDVDVLIEFEPDAHVSAFAIGEMQYELSTMFARPVDFVLKDGLKRRIRTSILDSAEVIYAN